MNKLQLLILKKMQNILRHADNSEAIPKIRRDMKWQDVEE